MAAGKESAEFAVKSFQTILKLWHSILPLCMRGSIEIVPNVVSKLQVFTN